MGRAGATLHGPRSSALEIDLTVRNNGTMIASASRSGSPVVERKPNARIRERASLHPGPGSDVRTDFVERIGHPG